MYLKVIEDLTEKEFEEKLEGIAEKIAGILKIDLWKIREALIFYRKHSITAPETLQSRDGKNSLKDKDPLREQILSCTKIEIARSLYYITMNGSVTERLAVLKMVELLPD